MIVEAIERARAYAEAGADGVFVPGLADITLIARLAAASPLALNIMIGDAEADRFVAAVEERMHGHVRKVERQSALRSAQFSGFSIK